MLNRINNFLFLLGFTLYGCSSNEDDYAMRHAERFLTQDSSTFTFIIDTSDVIVKPAVAVNENLDQAVLFSAADNSFLFYKLMANESLYPFQRISFPKEGENNLGKNDSYDVKYSWMNDTTLILLNKKYNLLYIIDILKGQVKERIKLSDYLEEELTISNDGNLQFEVYDSLVILNISPGRFNPNAENNMFEGPLFAIFNLSQRSFRYIGQYTKIYKSKLWGSNLSFPNFSYNKSLNAFYYNLPLHDSIWILTLPNQEVKSLYLKKFPPITSKPLGMDGLMGGLFGEISYYLSQAKIVNLKVLHFNNKPLYWLTVTQQLDDISFKSFEEIESFRIKYGKLNLELLVNEKGEIIGSDTIPEGVRSGYFIYQSKIFMPLERETEERIIFSGFQIRQKIED
jgi:hypothetical protein